MRTPKFFIALIGIAELLFASPPAKASATIGGKPITIKYGAPSVRGRQISGDGGLLSTDWTYPVWRAGANAATTLINAPMELGRVDMKMDRLKALVEKLCYAITTAGNTGTIQLEWENHLASVPIRAT